jgi:pimeloyl-ACP methyl ester carboxylesterase
MRRVTSTDGTPIAYDRQGSGPAVILVGGGLVGPVTGWAGRWENAPLPSELAARFTVYSYDRRGRARQVLEGLTHVGDPKVLAPVLERFYNN